MNKVSRRSVLLIAMIVVAFGGHARAFDSWNLFQHGYSSMGVPASVQVGGDMAYVAAGRSLLAVDISNTADPQIAEALATPGGAKGLLLEGGVLYSGQGAEGIKIYTVSPALPHLTLSGTEGTSLNAYALDAVNDHLYVADGKHGLRIYDRTDPMDLVLRSTLDIPDYDFYDVEVIGDLAYTMTIRNEWDLFFPTLKVLDVSDPSAPFELASMEFPAQGEPGSVIVDGSHVYLTDGYGKAHVSKYNYPSTITPINTIEGPTKTVALMGTTLLTVGYGWARMYDVSDPVNEIELATVFLSGMNGTLWTDGSTAVLPSTDRGVVLFDVSDPATFNELGRVVGASFPGEIELTDSAFFVADRQMLVLGGTPVVPMPVLGTNEGLGTDRDVEIGDDGIVYVSGTFIRAIDVSDPTDPQTLSSTNPPGQTLDLSVIGTTVYSAQYSSGFAITDFADPGNPQSVGIFPSHHADDLVAAGDFVYVADEGNTIKAIDVSDLGLPLVTDMVPHTDVVGAMHVIYDELFVAGGREGVRIFDISSPDVLSEVGVIPAQDLVWDVDVDGVWAWVADGNYVRVYDIHDRANPVELAYHETAGTVRTVRAGWNNLVAFAGVYGAGVYLFWPTVTTTAPAPAVSTIALRAWPNPVRSHATFGFTLGWDDEVDLYVYDMAGRVIRSWDHQARAGLPSLIRWDGRDRLGRGVANGVYFYRLDSSRGAQTGSVVLRR